MRKEDFYDVFEYGDRLEPGVELKIEHSITMEYDTPDLTPFTNSDVKELESLRKISAGTEQKIFDSLKEPLSKWERQAALTKLLDRAIQYLKMPEVEHTSNQWMHDDRSDRDKISNRVYQMSVSVYEDYKYDRQTRERIPTAWYVTWDVTINTPRRGYGKVIAGQRQKRYTDKDAALEIYRRPQKKPMRTCLQRFPRPYRRNTQIVSKYTAYCSQAIPSRGRNRSPPTAPPLRF